jgi:hypothetical protein
LQQGINTLQANYLSAMTAAQNALAYVQILFSTNGCATTSPNAICSSLTNFTNGLNDLGTFWNSSSFSQSTTPTDLTLIRTQASTGVNRVNVMTLASSAITSFLSGK